MPDTGVTVVWAPAGTVGSGEIHTFENDTGPDDANHAQDGLLILVGPGIEPGFREGMHLQFRAEAFNVFNHPQFQGPDMSVGDSNFGVITSTVNHPRELQLALKLYF